MSTQAPFTWIIPPPLAWGTELTFLAIYVSELYFKFQFITRESFLGDYWNLATLIAIAVPQLLLHVILVILVFLYLWLAHRG